mmetsp:Transcript_9521/g.11968  ORF Transcript_9521/g.11968 Transcript_9521/m.11968 type:complete len:212 (+) Transcript_9521:295-930(+)
MPGTATNSQSTNQVFQRSSTNAAGETSSSPPASTRRSSGQTSYSSPSTRPPKHRELELEGPPTSKTVNYAPEKLQRFPPPTKSSLRRVPCPSELPLPSAPSSQLTTRDSNSKYSATQSSSPRELPSPTSPNLTVYSSGEYSPQRESKQQKPSHPYTPTGYPENKYSPPTSGPPSAPNSLPMHSSHSEYHPSTPYPHSANPRELTSLKSLVQ